MSEARSSLRGPKRSGGRDLDAAVGPGPGEGSEAALTHLRLPGRIRLPRQRCARHPHHRPTRTTKTAGTSLTWFWLPLSGTNLPSSGPPPSATPTNLLRTVPGLARVSRRRRRRRRCGAQECPALRAPIGWRGGRGSLGTSIGSVGLPSGPPRGGGPGDCPSGAGHTLGVSSLLAPLSGSPSPWPSPLPPCARLLPLSHQVRQVRRPDFRGRGTCGGLCPRETGDSPGPGQLETLRPGLPGRRGGSQRP